MGLLCLTLLYASGVGKIARYGGVRFQQWPVIELMNH